MRVVSLWAFAIALVAVQPAAALAQQAANETARTPDVPYIPTPDVIVQKMLTMAHVGKNDIVYDPGCGDGRIVIAAVKQFGARGVGIDIDPARIQDARENAVKAGVADRVTFLNQDLFQSDLREATVVMLYLFQSLNLQLRPKLLAELKPGSRIVSHAFDMGDWKPEEKVQLEGRLVYKWTVPKR